MSSNVIPLAAPPPDGDVAWCLLEGSETVAGTSTGLLAGPFSVLDLFAGELCADDVASHPLHDAKIRASISEQERFSRPRDGSRRWAKISRAAERIYRT